MYSRLIRPLLNFATTGKRLLWSLGLVEIVTWISLIKSVGLIWTLVLLVLPKILIFLYQWWRWHSQVKFAVSRLESIAKSEDDPSFHEDELLSQWFSMTLLALRIPGFVSYVAVFFLFLTGRKRVLTEASKYFAQREKDENAS